MENPKVPFFISFITAYTKLLTETYKDGLFKDAKIWLSFEPENFVHWSRNRMIEKAISLGADFLIMVDDDMVLPPQTFTRLLEKAQEGGVVAPVMYQKHPPFKTVIYSQARDTGIVKQLDGIPKGLTGMLEVDGVGFGCVCIPTAVLKKIPAPWCELTKNESDRWKDGGEDLALCAKIRKLGTLIWVDLGLTVGHFGVSIVDEKGPRVV